METLASRWSKLVRLFQVTIWQAQYLKDRSLKGRLFAVVRIISITVSGLTETNAASRAAALSFSSLLGIGPLVAIAVGLSAVAVLTGRCAQGARRMAGLVLALWAAQAATSLAGQVVRSALNAQA